MDLELRLFSAINLADPFFDSLKAAYPEFEQWYAKKAAAGESCFAEVDRVRICPREGKFGIQVPLGAWHSIEVYEPSTIFEAKDGKYGE